ncbi:hypothetical protein BDQ17DRAFT_1435162 [Cyathus striatus]|nr:hypothetical protein BDQ17DRAFT_1435162 [Cyathus striatus]
MITIDEFISLFGTSTKSPEHPSPGESGSNEVTTHTPTSVQERAIEHAKQENKIRSIFAGLGIGSKCYTISAGFNELLIREGGARLEEIHIYIGSSAQIYFKSVYFSDFLASLGKIISPFPGSVYVGDDKPVPTPVSNDEGDEWNFDDMVMDRLHKQRSEVLEPIIITFDDGHEQEKPKPGNNFRTRDQPSDPSGSGNAGDNGNEDEDGDGDPKDPEKSKEPLKPPEYPSRCTNHGSNVYFTRECLMYDVQQPILSDTSRRGPYQLSDVIVKVNSGYEDAIIEAERVRTTPERAGEIQRTETDGKSAARELDVGIEAGLQPKGTFTFKVEKEIMKEWHHGSTKLMTNNIRSWSKFSDEQLPKVSFEFWEAPEIPKKFKVIVESFWKIPYDIGSAYISFSNVYHKGELEVPYSATKSTHQKTKHYVWINGLGMKPSSRNGEAEVVLTPSFHVIPGNDSVGTRRPSGIRSGSSVRGVKK